MEPHKQAEIDSRTPEFLAHEASKPFGWSPSHWVEWATVTEMTHALKLEHGSRIIDVGCGNGWTTLFLAEAGFEPLGIDLVPGNVALARERAARWSSRARFAEADMDVLAATQLDGSPFDAALLFDALHHSTRQADVLRGIAGHLRPGGWLLLGEPTWLHSLSPRARADTRARGWKERGLHLRGLRRDLRAAGFGETRRFFQPTRPYASRTRGFAWQLTRLVGANVLVAPGGHFWIAARRDGDPALRPPSYSTVA
jgi:SAM-dependent methyltransferase